MANDEYRLAEKLRSRFTERGSSVDGMRASSTSELMRRAQMDGNPNVNCAEIAFNESIDERRRSSEPRRQGGSYAGERGTYNSGRGASERHTEKNTARVNDKKPREQIQRTESRERANSSARTGTSVRRTPPQTGDSARTGTSTRSTSERNGSTRAGTSARNTSAQSLGSKHAVGVMGKREPSRGRKEGCREIKDPKPERRRMTPTFALLLLVSTMMVMVMVVSISDVYKTAGDITVLEARFKQLEEKEDKLELELEKKNDIRVIERLAAEEYGMVKEDYVQRKYISVSDGERIDLIENESSDIPKNTSGMLLSSILASLDSLFDYFR